MCGTCGCNQESHTAGTVGNHHEHAHIHSHPHSHNEVLNIGRKILNKNDALAENLRQRLAEHGVYVVNLVSSPGSGKTELLHRVLSELGENYSSVALTGDLATENDARHLAQSGAPVKQILTGTLCHLEANMIENAIADWDLTDVDFLFIENVGNLVCPGNFDLGEDLRVMLIATTEGEDKPIKYPALAHTADAVIISKMDLADVVECRVDLLEKNITEVCADVPVFKVSARNGSGLNEWLAFLRERAKAKQSKGQLLSRSVMQEQDGLTV